MTNYLMLELIMILISVIIIYSGYQYVSDIMGALGDPGFMIFIRFLLLGIALNFLILTSIVIYYHYANYFVLRGDRGPKGIRGDPGLPGGEVCLKNHQDECSNPTLNHN